MILTRILLSHFRVDRAMFIKFETNLHFRRYFDNAFSRVWRVENYII